MLISLLMPVKDAERYLSPLLHSVSNQRFTDWELVAVDDGSSDASFRILEEFSRKDTRARLLRNRGTGIVDALNTALAAACGRWTVRIDADDVCHPDLLRAIAREIEVEPGAHVHATRIRYFPRQGLGEGLMVYEEWINSLISHEDITRDMFVECPMPHPTLTCLREDLLSLGGYRDMGWPEDYDLVLRLWERGSRFSKVPWYLYFWRDSETRLSRTDSRYSLEMFTEAKVEFLLRTRLEDTKAAVVAGAGPVGKDFARRLIRRGVRVRAFLEVNPARIGKSIYGIPVMDVKEAGRMKGTKILHAVGQKGTRIEARKLYDRMGLRETEDFLFVS